MSDATDNKTLVDGNRNLVVRRTCVSDGSGESAAKFIDISEYNDEPNTKQEPNSLRVDRIEWDIQGFTSVRLFFDASTDDEIVVLGPGSGSKDYSAAGGQVDPKTSGTTGDILITTVGAASGDTYTITLWCVKKYPA